MQRAKLFGALFAYVNNIQVTWKTIHLSVFFRTNSPSTDQSRAEGNNTECVANYNIKYICTIYIMLEYLKWYIYSRSIRR
jgi:hypothetical protein